MTKQLRSFGFIMATFFAVFIALMPLLRHGDPVRVWALIAALVFLVPAIFYPKVLQPFYKIWMLLGGALGFINSRIILTIIFYGIITPVGLIRRVLGRDPLRLRFDKKASTYREKMDSKPVALERQF